MKKRRVYVDFSARNLSRWKNPQTYVRAELYKQYIFYCTKMFKTVFKMLKSSPNRTLIKEKNGVLNNVYNFCEKFSKLRIVACSLQNIQYGARCSQKLRFFLVHFAIVKTP